MPIYEFACPKCKVIFNFFSKRINPERSPVCPKCGNNDMVKLMSRFSTPKGLKEPAANNQAESNEPSLPDFDDPRVERVMREIERDIEHLDENNPRHLAYMMKKLKDVMPPDAMPKQLDTAIRRLEAGEDPEKIEEDMGEELSQLFGDDKSGDDYSGYAHDSGLYDY